MYLCFMIIINVRPNPLGFNTQVFRDRDLHEIKVVYDHLVLLHTGICMWGT